MVQDRIKFVEEIMQSEPYLVELDNVGNVLVKVARLVVSRRDQ